MARTKDLARMQCAVSCVTSVSNSAKADLATKVAHAYITSECLMQFFIIGQQRFFFKCKVQFQIKESWGDLRFWKPRWRRGFAFFPRKKMWLFLVSLMNFGYPEHYTNGTSPKGKHLHKEDRLNSPKYNGASSSWLCSNNNALVRNTSTRCGSNFSGRQVSNINSIAQRNVHSSALKQSRREQRMKRFRRSTTFLEVDL